MTKNQDRTDLCHFVFTDGRRCQLPQALDDMGLCYFHAQKYRQHITAQEVGRQIAGFLDTDILTACDLNSAFATLFAATAQGYIKPKTTASLTYLGQLMLQTQRLAKQEFLAAFDEKWPKVVQEAQSFAPPAPDPSNPADPAKPSPETQVEPAQNDSATSDPAIPHPLTKIM
jgi:hypothetical protein